VTTDADLRAAAEPQAVLAPLTGAAIFLVVVAGEDAQSAGAVRDLCGSLAALVRAVGVRAPQAYLTCVTGEGPGRPIECCVSAPTKRLSAPHWKIGRKYEMGWSVRKRALGKTGLFVSEMGIGTWGLRARPTAPSTPPTPNA